MPINSIIIHGVVFPKDSGTLKNTRVHYVVVSL